MKNVAYTYKFEFPKNLNLYGACSERKTADNHDAEENVYTTTTFRSLVSMLGGGEAFFFGPIIDRISHGRQTERTSNG